MFFYVYPLDRISSVGLTSVLKACTLTSLCFKNKLCWELFKSKLWLFKVRQYDELFNKVHADMTISHGCVTTALFLSLFCSQHFISV